MREIKFRAWDSLNSRIIQDYFFVDTDGGAWYDQDPHGLDMSGKKKIKATDRLTLMQYTGMKDKNGVEIYEGDKDLHGNVVEFLNGTFCLNGDRPLYCASFEVAGNIYQKH